MKFLPSQLAFVLKSRTAQQNIGYLLKFLLMLAAVITLYSVLFHVIMQWEGKEYSWLTGVYWTLTVMSTLGFGDITFASDLGRLFSIVVLMSGVVFLLVMLPFTFIQFFYAPWLEAQAKARIPRELPPDTKNHIIIVGNDPTALNLADRLAQYGHRHAVLCADARRTNELHDMGYPAMLGDHDDPETYRRLRTGQAALVVALDSDVRNTNITFTLREGSPDVPVVCKVDQDDSLDILTLAGSTYVYQFTRLLGHTLARRIMSGGMLSNVLGRFDGLMVAEAPVKRSGLGGRTLRQCGLRAATGVNVLGVWERGRFAVPDPDAPLSESAVLVLGGTEEQIKAFESFSAVAPSGDGTAVILGGGRVGIAVAEQLREQGVPYRIVEKNAKLAHLDEHATVGSAADLEVLERAGIRTASAVFVTTHDDDLNIYLTIYCRRLRPDIQIISRATLDRNVGIMHTAGADLVMSHASLVATTVLNLLNPGMVLMLTEGLNLFRAPLPKVLAGKTLAESGIRPETGCNVVGIHTTYGLTLNPDPERVLEAGSELILIGDSDSEKRFLERYRVTGGARIASY